MLKRPLILKLFALFLVIDPFLRAMFISIEREFPFSTVLDKTLLLGFIDFFNFWFLFPLSGVLLLGVRVYSYVGFICIQLYSLYFHLNYQPYSWPYLSKTPSSSAYLLLSINVLMIIYLLLPRSREVFFDKNLRWWERGSRYKIDEPCFAKINGREVHGKVCDLSFGGALLQLDEPIPTGSEISLEFDLLNKNLTIGARIVRIINVEGEPRFGTQFLFNNYWGKVKLKFLMFSISKVSHYEKYR